LFDFAPPAPGQFVEVRLAGEAVEQAMWLPQSALYEREQVLVANDNELNIKAINVIAAADGKILASGLEDGDLVVTDRPLWVFPGQEITPIILEN